MPPMMARMITIQSIKSILYSLSEKRKRKKKKKWEGPGTYDMYMLGVRPAGR